jgi:hypothetical protein
MAKFARVFDIGEDDQVLFVAGHDNDGPFLNGIVEVGMHTVQTKVYFEFNGQARGALEGIQQVDAEGFYAEIQNKFKDGIIPGLTT